MCCIVRIYREEIDQPQRSTIYKIVQTQPVADTAGGVRTFHGGLLGAEANDPCPFLVVSFTFSPLRRSLVQGADVVPPESPGLRSRAGNVVQTSGCQLPLTAAFRLALHSGLDLKD